MKMGIIIIVTGFIMFIGGLIMFYSIELGQIRSLIESNKKCRYIYRS